MSARQPFVPQRSGSRVAPAPPPEDVPAEENFRPTGLLTEAGTSINEENNNTQSSRTSRTNFADGINKPLNLAGFVKKKGDLSQLDGKHHKSFGDPSARSHSPTPNQALRVIAPRPSSPFFPNSNFFPKNFRASTLPSPSRLQSVTSGDSLSTNQAHIPSSHNLSVDSTAPSDDPQSFGRRNQSHGGSARRASSHSSLEKIHEAAEEEEEPALIQRFGGFGAPDDSGHPPYDGPHGNANPQDRHLQSPEYGSEDMGGNVGQQPLRRVKKRAERPEDIEDEMDYGTVKRYKADISVENQIGYTDSYSRQTTPASHYRHPDQNVTPGAPIRVHPQSALGQHHTHLVIDYSAAPASVSSDQHALRRLLGQDFDAVADKHLAAYTEAKKKWSECSMDEWRAGADEMAGKFAKLIDFVKDHMTTKLALYATLRTTVSAHRAVLSEREKTLQDVRESLVRDGANVVGSRTSVSVEEHNG